MHPSDFPTPGSSVGPLGFTLRALASRPRTVAGVFLVVFAFVLWNPPWLCPLWTGRATLVVGPDPAMLQSEDSEFVDGIYHSFSAKHESIYAESVAANAARLAMGLEEFVSPVLTSEAAKRRIASLREHVTAEFSDVGLREHGARIHDSLLTTHDGRSQCVELRTMHPDPEVATLWAWCVAEAAARRHRDRLRAIYDQTATRVEYALAREEHEPARAALRRAQSQLLTESACGEGPVQVGHVDRAVPLWGDIPDAYRLFVALAVGSAIALVVGLALSLAGPARRCPQVVPIAYGAAGCARTE